MLSLTNPRQCAIVLRKPHAQQLKFLRSKAKRKVVRAGRRSGKTTGMGVLAVESFLAGKRVLYATPTADQIKKFWAEVTTTLQEPINNGAYYKNETEHIIHLKGSEQRIRAKTAWDADSLRGDYADLLILDEWQLMDENAWGEVGAPMLIDNNGDACFVYTPPSLKVRLQSKAQDIHHARKLFLQAAKDTTGRWEAFHFTSYDNPHLSREGLDEITADMTNLAYRQEIMAEDIDEVPGAIWTRDLLEKTRIRIDECPELARIVIGIDPPGSDRTEAGIVAAGVDKRGHGYVIADASLLAVTPRIWASAAVALYHDRRADRILGETNYGGNMVEAVIRNVDNNVSYKNVNATRGKMVRAEPICALYEKGLIHHVGSFPDLEDEMCSYVPGNPSPNRMDAMVWTMTELMPGYMLGGLLQLMKQQAEENKAAETVTSTADAAAVAQKKAEDKFSPYPKRKTPKPKIILPDVCGNCGATGLGQQGETAICNLCGWDWRKSLVIPDYQVPTSLSRRVQ